MEFLSSGCSKKPSIVCESQNDLFTTEVGLYFDGNNLKDAYSISTYKEESLATQVCDVLGEKVKCYKNNVEIVSFYDNYKNSTKFSIVNDLENQGFVCK